MRSSTPPLLSTGEDEGEQKKLLVKVGGEKNAFNVFPGPECFATKSGPAKPNLPIRTGS